MSNEELPISYPFNKFATVANIEKALSFIPADDRDICVNGFVFAKNVLTLSQADIEKQKAEQKARQLKANKAQNRRKYYAKKSLNKLIPELLTTADPMARYFYSRDLGLFKTPEQVMYHPAMPYYEDGQLLISTPTIVSLITDIEENVEAFHKIHITENGHKASVPSSKKISTPINTITGCSVKFKWPNDELYLGSPQFYGE